MRVCMVVSQSANLRIHDPATELELSVSNLSNLRGRHTTNNSNSNDINTSNEMYSSYLYIINIRTQTEPGVAVDFAGGARGWTMIMIMIIIILFIYIYIHIHIHT